MEKYFANTRKYFCTIGLSIFLGFFGLVSPCAAQTMTREEILQNIQPVGQVTVEQQAADNTKAADEKLKKTQEAAIDPKAIYDQYCMACHTTGAAGAPKLGNKAIWQTRLKAGKKRLYQNAIKGIKLMPAKGGCANCSDKSIELTVDYMLKQAGL